MRKQAFIKTLILVVAFFLLDLGFNHALHGGIIRYYGLDKAAGILCVGHSHMVLGIDADLLERDLGVRVAKYAIAGANVLDRYWMIRHALDVNPGVRTVIYEVDTRLFDREGLSSASYTLFLPFIQNAVMSRYLKQEATWQEYYTCKFIRTARYRDQTLNIALRGILHKAENEKTGTLDVEKRRAYLEREQQRRVKIDPESVNCFYKTMTFLTSRNIGVVLVNLPVADVLDLMEPETHRTVMELFNRACAANKHLHLLDYGKDYSGDYSLFFDYRHLNAKGKELVTKRLAEDLKQLNVSADDTQDPSIS